MAMMFPPPSPPSVIVLGSGIAGLTAALALAPRPVWLITKTNTLASGSTTWAQGGIAAALGPDDSPAFHATDTLTAGAGLSDPTITDILTQDGVTAIADLLRQGAPFDLKPDGTPLLGREAAHSLPRVTHAGGDSTGRVIGNWLIQKTIQAPHITVLTDCFAQDLIVHDNRVSGVFIHDATHGWRILKAQAVILATGGWGVAWSGTTNPSENTGDGLAMASRANALLADLEFMQFHPTALAVGQDNGTRLPLLTEALRGAGAVLLDHEGTRFMPDTHPLAELAPRDIVARAVGARIAAGQKVFLDLRPALAAKGKAAFPQVLAACRDAGFDPWSAPVPITPAAHYAMGGIAVDRHGRTSLNGLWAVGETACTGIHGANRLASNSLLEGIVFGRHAAADILQTATSHDSRPPGALPEPPPVIQRAEADSIRACLRQTMGRFVGLVRDDKGLRMALETVSRLEDRFRNAPHGVSDVTLLRFSGETRNLLTVARLVITAALERCESRGAHWRADYPQTDPHQARRHFQRHSDGANPPCQICKN